MKYHPSLPPHNDNVTHQHPLKEFFQILGGLLLLAALAFWCLGLLIDAVVDRLSPEAEAALNRVFATEWLQRPATAPHQEAMLQALVDELRACAGLTQPVRVHLIDSPQTNAAVLPGGHVLVFSGLLDQVKSRNGLAFVFAHELAHLKHRDHLRAMGRSVVLVALSTLLTGGNSQITELLVPVNQVGNARYSRVREALADAEALQVLHCRYGHVGGATELFEALKKQEGADAGGWSHYLASHPALQARIDSLRQTIEKKQWPSAPVLPFVRG